jgi:hypothetical protein
MLLPVGSVGEDNVNQQECRRDQSKQWRIPHPESEQSSGPYQVVTPVVFDKTRHMP